MYSVEIKPSVISGSVNLPPSKSLTHRALISASLSFGKSIVDNVDFSEDILATINALEIYGARFLVKESTLYKGRKKIIVQNAIEFTSNSGEIDCRESGSTLRFMIPLALMFNGKFVFKGSGKLSERPLDPYFKIFREKNIKFHSNNGKLPLSIDDKITSGIFSIKGDVSSQFITGLMFILPILEGNSEIKIEGDLESKAYIDLTIDVLKRFGIKIKNIAYKKFLIEGNQKYLANDYVVEGDYSQSAFWIVAGSISNKFSIKGLDKNSNQGDKEILDIFRKMNGEYDFSDSELIVAKSDTNGTIIDGSECPDIIPILAVLASLSKGKTTIVNAKRLRLKESDRLKAISTELNKIGAHVVETEDGLIISGVEYLNGGEVESWNDHRIAMSLAIASLRSKKPITISGAQCINKSYPKFWDDLASSGCKVTIIK